VRASDCEFHTNATVCVVCVERGICLCVRVRVHVRVYLCSCVFVFVRAYFGIGVQ